MRGKRFQISPVAEEDNMSVNSFGSYKETQLVEIPANDVRRNSRTVPALPSDQDRRKYSLAQLTRYVHFHLILIILNCNICKVVTKKSIVIT